MFLKKKMNNSIQDFLQNEVIVIGAGSGLSTSAGYTYSGIRFERYFKDFIDKYDFTDMYSGGFYPFETLEEYWGYWSRYIYINRYTKIPSDLYDTLLKLVENKDYFVLTTNVDHCFQKSGFDKKRLFYTQGDYGLFQCSKPCHQSTYDNGEVIKQMVLAQGFTIGPNSELLGEPTTMKIPSELIPYCPHCGEPMTMNLRADSTFVQGEGWYKAAERYQTFLRTRSNQPITFLELGVGYNTPSIIKYSFWNMTDKFINAKYICINQGEAYVPKEIESKSICINADIGDTLSKL